MVLGSFTLEPEFYEEEVLMPFLIVRVPIHQSRSIFDKFGSFSDGHSTKTSDYFLQLLC